MHSRSSVLALAALTLSLTARTAAPVGEVAAAEPVTPPITIQSASADWARRVDWGLGRFRQAGLPLPAMVIAVHDNQAPCDGESGLYHPADPVEIHLCSSSDPDSGPAKLITLHELAHAWAESELDEDERAAFVELRGLDSWSDSRHRPYEWGAEHAAETISWGLMDTMGPIIRINDAAPAQLLTAYQSLVHQPPLWTDPPRPDTSTDHA